MKRAKNFSIHASRLDRGAQLRIFQILKNQGIFESISKDRITIEMDFSIDFKLTTATVKDGITRPMYGGTQPVIYHDFIDYGESGDES